MTWALYAVAAAAVTVVGFVGAFESRGPLRKVLMLNVASSGVFLVLVASARRIASERPDPVPHALVLTGIVVSVSATGLALCLARRLAARREPPGGARR
jgi:multicomponent Na+:H+ antiporter subunit C